MMDDTFAFSTERLRLRAMEPEDLDFFYALENATELWAYGNANVPYSRYVLRCFLSESHNDLFADKQLRLIIEDVKSGCPIGCLDLMSFCPLHNRAEVGIVVTEPFQRKGIGKEALRLLLAYTEKHLHLHQLYAYVAERNTAALRLFRSVGFTEASYLKDWLRCGDGYTGCLVYQKVF